MISRDPEYSVIEKRWQVRDGADFGLKYRRVTLQKCKRRFGPAAQAGDGFIYRLSREHALHEWRRKRADKCDCES